MPARKRDDDVVLHGHVEENGEEELVVDGHRDEAALVELGRRLADDDTQPDAPDEDHHLHWSHDDHAIKQDKVIQTQHASITGKDSVPPFFSQVRPYFL